MTLDDLIRRTKERVERRQRGIPTYYDGRVLRQEGEPDPAWHSRFERHEEERARGRFVAWEERAGDAGTRVAERSEIPPEVLTMSQGRDRCLSWRGLDLFKSVFDFALVPMLIAELRPASILEIGSGSGASALWMADLADLCEVDCEVVSVDLQPVALSRPGVRFLTGDARDLDRLGAGTVARGPRLVVEDAHAAVDEVLAAVHPQLQKGDYLIVEDSIGKGDALRAFFAADPGAYAVDTFYTDFFGRNATSCIDSILRRMR